MKFLYALSISIFAICNAQHSTEYVKLDDNGKDMMSMSIPKLQSHNDVAVCMNELDALGKILDDYRRIILSGLTASSDICGFIENLADVGDDKLLDTARIDDMSIVSFYRNMFRNLDDPILRSQLESLIDACFEANRTLQKRDKSAIQRVRFHSWGGKRNRGAPKIVIRTPFHAWGGKRSMDPEA